MTRRRIAQLDLFGDTPTGGDRKRPPPGHRWFRCDVCRLEFVLPRDALACPVDGGQLDLARRAQ